MNAERQQLAEEYIRLADWCARREHRRCLALNVPSDMEDLRGEALLALCKAAAGYDPTRGVRFSTYAVQTIQYHWACLHDRIRSRKRQRVRSDKPLCTVPHAAPGDPGTAVDHRTSPQAAMEATDSVAHLKAVLAPRWFDVLWDCFAEGRQQSDIAREVGCTRSRVGQRIHEAIGHARRKLKGETHIAEAVPPTSTGRFGTHAGST